MSSPERRAPSDLSSAGDAQRRWASKWRDVRDHLVDQGTWQEQDADTLDDYIRTLARAEGLRQTLDLEGLTTRGSQGQLVKHPAAAMLREAEQDARGLRADLLYTAQQRSRHEIGGTDGTDEAALAEVLD